MNSALFQLIDLIFQFLYLILIVRVVLSWIPHDPHHPIISVVYRITDPILKPFQNLVPSWKVGLDLSPIFAFIALGILQSILYRFL